MSGRKPVFLLTTIPQKATWVATQTTSPIPANFNWKLSVFFSSLHGVTVWVKEDESIL